MTLCRSGDCRREFLRDFEDFYLAVCNEYLLDSI